MKREIAKNKTHSKIVANTRCCHVAANVGAKATLDAKASANLILQLQLADFKQFHCLKFSVRRARGDWVGFTSVHGVTQIPINCSPLFLWS